MAGLLRAMLVLGVSLTVLELFLPDFLEHALLGDSMLARVPKWLAIQRAWEL
jgi:hypothetical protein